MTVSVGWSAALGLLCGLLLAGGACAEAGRRGESAPSVDAAPAPDAARQILVTFADERESRLPIGDSVSGYRRRGDYGNSTWSERRAAELAEDYGLVRNAQWPITALGVHCVVYEVPALLSLDSILRRLAGDQRVESAQSMRSFRVMSASQQPGAGGADPYLRMQAGLRAMRVEEVHRYTTGRNVTVIVIDTGADENHPELKGRVSARESFVPTSPETAGDIHGTAVSGIIAAAAGNGQGIVGIAPDAHVRVMKACWQSGGGLPDAQCNTFTLALALNTAIDARPQIINLSLNGPADPLLQRLIAKAVDDGIIVVASQADAPGPDNEFPASIPGVFAVRAAAAPPSSPRPATRSLAAPGREILTTVPNNAYGFMTGSSFAAAHVSGLIALLLELNPDLTRERIGSILTAASVASNTEARCSHCIDACQAVSRLIARPNLCPSNQPQGQRGS